MPFALFCLVFVYQGYGPYNCEHGHTIYAGDPDDLESSLVEIGTFACACVLLLLEIWDIGIYLYTAITRQHNLEALTVNAPPPPLLFPVPGGVLMDQHRRHRDKELELRQFPYKASARFSMNRILTMMNYFPKDSSSLWGFKTPLWLKKAHHIVGGAISSLVTEYIFHQPTTVLVWIFISLIFSHFFMWIDDGLPMYGRDEKVAAAAIVGWLYLVRKGGPHFRPLFAFCGFTELLITTYSF